jgi:NADPH2:quinone reductase
MKATWYERQGAASDVLVVGEMPTPEPGPGEVRIRVAASGINPGDVKKRSDTFGVGMPYSRVIPHSDGAGEIDQVGDGVTASRNGERVWCFGAQSYRPLGTAAEHVVVPAEQAIPLPDSISVPCMLQALLRSALFLCKARPVPLGSVPWLWPGTPEHE